MPTLVNPKRVWNTPKFLYNLYYWLGRRRGTSPKYQRSHFPEKTKNGQFQEQVICPKLGKIVVCLFPENYIQQSFPRKYLINSKRVANSNSLPGRLSRAVSVVGAAIAVKQVKVPVGRVYHTWAQRGGGEDSSPDGPRGLTLSCTQPHPTRHPASILYF